MSSCAGAMLIVIPSSGAEVIPPLAKHTDTAEPLPASYFLQLPVLDVSVIVISLNTQRKLSATCRPAPPGVSTPPAGRRFMPQHQRLALLILIMAAVTIAVTGVALTALYQTAFAQTRQRLVEIVANQARQLEAIAHHEYGQSWPAQRTPPALAASVVRRFCEVQERLPGFGTTGEFTLARRVGDEIVFVLQQRHPLANGQQHILLAGSAAEPMRRALNGVTGTMVGPDYRNVTVLAVFRPLPDLGLGLVAKMDLAEIRQPFLRTAGLALTFAIFLTCIGALLFQRVGEPLVQELEEKEQRYRTLFENVSDAVLLLNGDTLVDFNRQALQLFTGGHATLPTLPLVELAPPQQPDGTLSTERFQQCQQRAREAGGARFPWRGLTHDGRSLDLQVMLKPVILGRRHLLCATIQDMTAQSQAQREREATERRYRRSFELSRIGMAITSLGKGWLEVNQALCELLGYSRAQLQHMTWAELTHPDDLARDETQLNRILAGEIDDYALEKRFIHRDGSVRHAFVAVNTVRDSRHKIEYFVAIVKDITERKRAEQSLRESELRFRNVFESAALGVVLASASDSPRVEQANAAFARFIGYDPAEVPGLGIRALAPPEDLPAWTEAIEEVMRGERSGLEMDHRYVRRDRSLVWGHVSATLVRDERGEPWLWIVLVQDIDRQKKADKQLQQTLLQLQHSNRELEQFAYIASHDLQEPLRTVSGFAQLLARRYQGRLDADADEFIGFMVEGVERMQRLINDLLGYSRLGREGVPMVPVALDRVLQAVTGNLSAAIAERRAVIDSEPLPQVLGNEPQLIQLLQNLLANAIKFCARQPQIRISARQQGPLWEIAVTDNGIGIAPEHHGRIFQIFQRLHPRDEYSGTGLGLALCQRIAHCHGGEIRVDSIPGQNSCFTFTLKGAPHDTSCSTGGDPAGRRQSRRRAPDARGAQRGVDRQPPERRARRGRDAEVPAAAAPLCGQTDAGFAAARPEHATQEWAGGVAGDQKLHEIAETAGGGSDHLTG